MLKAIFLVTLSLICLDYVSGQCREVTIDDCSYTKGPFESVKGENSFYLPGILGILYSISEKNNEMI